MQHRILLITSFSKPWNNGWFYKAGFEKNGDEVITCDPSTMNDPDSEIVTLIRKKKPDFILHTKDELPVEAFEKFKKLTKIVMWYPDSVVAEWLWPYVSNADIFFTVCEGLVSEFKKYNSETFFLSQAFEPSFFQVNQINDNDRTLFGTQVAFVGSLCSKAHYLMRRGALEKVIDSGFQLKWWGPRISRKFSTIPLILSKLGRAYGGKFVWGEEYAKVSMLSKIFLAFDAMPYIRKSMSARMYTAVGCGAFYVCQHVDGIEDVLVPGKEIVTFQSADEMIDLIRFYLKNEDERRKIAEAGQRRVLKDHTYEIRIRELNRMIYSIR